MEFRIADTFTDSLVRLTGEEQKAVKTTAFDLQLNPASPGISFHKLDRAKDKNFWSVRVGSNIRLIVHRNESNLLLCYVAHHDKAYHWAERRKLETHPKTGAAQLVEVRESIQEIFIPKYLEVEKPLQPKSLIFAGLADDVLLSYGVPVEWLNDVRKANEDTVLELADHLPSEAAEALLEIATGGIPQVTKPVITDIKPFEHPDAQRRFRVMTNIEELQRALEYPWDKWTIFLHPAQRHLVEGNYNGPARVSGSAGTGKTIVALHRAVFLARKNPNARILLTTFSDALANALRTKLRRLISNEPHIAERLEIHAMDAIGKRLYDLNVGRLNLASKDVINKSIKEIASRAEDHKFSNQFLFSEWEQVVDAWQVQTWEAYRDVVRLGRKTRLPEKPRRVLWSIFENVRSELRTNNLITYADMFSQLASHFAENKHQPFDYVIVDESQDINVSQLRFLAALNNKQPNRLFFAGDLGQRIFQQAFSWKSLGIDIRGRARTLHINYRTSHQIRMQCDKLLAPSVSDVDGNIEERRGTVSVFNGQLPKIIVLEDQEAEIISVGQWLSDLKKEDIKFHEIGIFVRSSSEIDRACKAVKNANFPYVILNENIEIKNGHVSISTMHLAKGMEFRAVVVMACDDQVIPLQERIETVTDDSDLEEVYNTERHLLYVACTRARDFLLVTSVDPASEFLDDLRI